MNEHLRQTGRTTRMIEEACRAAECGRAVYVLTSVCNVKLLQNAINKHWINRHPEPGLNSGIKVESMEHWERHQLWDWGQMQPSYKGAHQSCLWLVDHYVVELKLEQIHSDIKYLTTLAGRLYPHTV